MRLACVFGFGFVIVAACGGGSNQAIDAADVIDADDGGPDAAIGGMVTAVTSLPSCPAGAPPGATCQQITVRGCPGIEDEAIDATIAVVAEAGTRKGTIVHFIGGGGEGFQIGGAAQYRTAGFLQVFVSWATDREQTQSQGIKLAACRPATVLRWVFAEPALHGASRTIGFCGEGFSGGSAQLGYALAHYGLGDQLDYVNELSGPPFARIDLGCDDSAPATATVCGAQVTMRLPAARMDPWENTTTCGTAAPSGDVARWMADSISIGGVYAYPQTRVEFFDCTNNATAVTGMAQLYYQQIMAGTTSAYHCYAQADGCMGEGLGSGAQDATDQMIAQCVPRHS